MKNKKIFIILLIIPVIIFFIGRSFSQLQEVKSVEIQSNDYQEPGSWHITKSAEWTGLGKARVTFDVSSVMKIDDGRYTDAILVVDISGSMKGDKLERAKSDAMELTNYLLSNSNNSIALITFDTSSTIVSNFIHDKEIIINNLDNLHEQENTNYNSALQNVDVIMDNYIQKENTDLVVLFLTDGYPNVDTPNQVATYHMLKDKYPYMTINGIQYEMGIDIIQEIKNISDRQWVADQDTLHNVLFDASLSSINYDNFVITDYVNDDYFYVPSSNNIKVDKGEVSIEVENDIQKIIWNLADTYRTGDSIKMTIALELKEEYHETKGYYPTNKSETIESKLPNESKKTANSTLTPILKNTYYVIYDTNTPIGCTLPTIDSEEHFVYQNVTKKSDSLSCSGYLFKGWKINDNDKTDMIIINDDTFVMPPHDVHISAIWTKQNLIKSMDGEVHEKMTLYKVLENEANIGTYAKKYTGEHQDSYDNSGSKDIYYYDASNSEGVQTIINEKNNVIFANHCWQILRTTDTGGVKLLYNGEAENDKCLDTRGNNIGYSSSLTVDLTGLYYYGTNYIYDKLNNNFKISGETEQVSVTSNNQSTIIPTLKGKYTCRKQNLDETCTTLYLVYGYRNSSSYIIPISKGSHYSQFGETEFNKSNNSPADVGYMYNKTYSIKRKILKSTQSMLDTFTLNLSYWYGNSIRLDSQLSLKYDLVDPFQITSTDDYPNLVGKYTLQNHNSTTGGYYAYYITDVDNNTAYYISLQSGKDYTDYNHTYTYGDSYIDNNDGTYTVTNQDGSEPKTTDLLNWYSNYSDIGKGKYICKNAINNSCNDLWYTTEVTAKKITYLKVNDNYKYGQEYEYKYDEADGKYKYYLKNDNSINIWNINNSDSDTLVSNHHYTCWNASGVCEELSYIYSSANFTDGRDYYYINVMDGKNIEDILDEMLFRDDDNYKVNKYDSTIKTAVDAWYKKYIYEIYDDYVEDTIYCNNRSIYAKNGWDLAGNVQSGDIQFKDYTNNKELICSNETDKFSIQNNKAKLTYKVGLVTGAEFRLFSYDYLRKISKSMRIMAPYSFQYYFGSYKAYGLHYSEVYHVLDESGIDNGYGVRPVISLIPNIEYVGGDGSMERPYLVDDGTH